MEQLILGFKHTVREGFSARKKISQPTDDKWCYGPPVVGAIKDGNLETKVRWLVRESCHDGGAQFEHLSIHDVKCSDGPVHKDTNLCLFCYDSKKSLLARCTSNVDIREKEYNPKTRIRSAFLLNNLECWNNC